MSVDWDASSKRPGFEGWYAIDERGNLLSGPFNNRELCLTRISQAANWAAYKDQRIAP